MMASSVGAKSWTVISPVGSATGISYSLTQPTSGLGPGAMENVYFDRSELYSSYVTWSARILGAVCLKSASIERKING